MTVEDLKTLENECNTLGAKIVQTQQAIAEDIHRAEMGAILHNHSAMIDLAMSLDQLAGSARRLSGAIWGDGNNSGK